MSETARKRFPVPLIVPSLYAADHSRLHDAVQAAWSVGIQHFHLDIMDGVFVPSIGLSIQLIADLRAAFPSAFFHAHLMTATPQALVGQAVEAGASSITFHIEATPHAENILRDIRAAGVIAGIALNPATTPAALSYLKHVVEKVLIMTVNPGYERQAFIPQMLHKVRQVRQLLPDAIISVDGQISADTLPVVARTGADFVVVGRSAFAGDPRQTLPVLCSLL